MSPVMHKQLIGRVGTWLGMALMVGAAWWVAKHYDVTELWVREAGWWGPFIAIGLYALLSLTPIPSDPLTILVGALYGWGWGFLISWAGNNSAALVEYFISRNIRQATHFEIKKKRLPKWLKKLPVTSLWFLIGARFVPGFGGKVVSVMAGVYDVSWWRFLWTTGVANIFGSLLYSLGGWSIVKLF